MKRTAKPGLPAIWQAGLGQGLENNENTCPPDGRRGPV